MTSFSSAMDAAAQQPSATWFAALEILFGSGATNLVPPVSPGNIPDWVNNATEVMSAYSMAPEGEFFFAQTPSNTTPFCYYLDVPVSPSTAYDLSADMQMQAATAGTAGRLYVVWLDDTKTTISYSPVAELTSPTSTWTHVSTGAITSPATAAYARVALDVVNTAATYSAGNVYWAAISLTASGGPNFALRLLDGAGVLTLFGNTFVGSDQTYGALMSIDSFSDGVGDDAPTMKVTLLPPNNTSMADLAAADVQGSQVSLWVGLVNPATGLPVSDPDLRFIGSVDVPTIQIDKNSKTLELACISSFEQFFRDDEGVRLSDAWHQSVWPGELGLQFVSGVQLQMPWGADAPRPVLVTDVSATQSALTNTSRGALGGGGGSLASALGGFR